MKKDIYLKISVDVSEVESIKPKASEAIRPFYGFSKFISWDEFEHGLGNFTFEWKDCISIKGNNVSFISNEDIYYDNSLLVKKGDSIPFFHQVTGQLGQDILTDKNAVHIVLDLRPAGVYGADFKFDKLGKDNGVVVTPCINYK